MPNFVSRVSWLTKKLSFIGFNVWMWLGILIYVGVVDISHKNQIEYGVVVSTYLFYMTFILDFGHKSMDIVRL